MFVEQQGSGSMGAMRRGSRPPGARRLQRSPRQQRPPCQRRSPRQQRSPCQQSQDDVPGLLWPVKPLTDELEGDLDTAAGAYVSCKAQVGGWYAVQHAIQCMSKHDQLHSQHSSWNVQYNPLRKPRCLLFMHIHQCAAAAENALITSDGDT